MQVRWTFKLIINFKQQFAGKHVARSGTLSGFRSNQSLLKLLNDARLAEKQQLPIILSLFNWFHLSVDL
jgi:hypothetical protein